MSQDYKLNVRAITLLCGYMDIPCVQLVVLYCGAENIDLYDWNVMEFIVHQKMNELCELSCIVRGDAKCIVYEALNNKQYVCALKFASNFYKCIFTRLNASDSAKYAQGVYHIINHDDCVLENKVLT